MPPSPDVKSSHRVDLVSEAFVKRLDRYLVARYSSFSRSYIQRLITEGYVTVNGKAVRPSVSLKRGDRVVVEYPVAPSTHLTPESVPLSVVYEDDEVLVIDKPAGIVTHPGPGHTTGTLAGALLAYHPALGGVGDPARPGIVHRLDKDTSGLLMVAKTDESLRSLAAQLKSRSVTKGYLALVKGRIEPSEGVIDAPLGRNPRHRKKIAVVAEGRNARTGYKTLKELDGYTLLEVAPETGRTHQIRVHLAAVGHPIIGDGTYGGRHPALSRQFLHASYLKFRLPGSGKEIELRSRLPQDLSDALETICSEGPRTANPL